MKSEVGTLIKGWIIALLSGHVLDLEIKGSTGFGHLGSEVYLGVGLKGQKSRFRIDRRQKQRVGK